MRRALAPEMVKDSPAVVKGRVVGRKAEGGGVPLQLQMLGKDINDKSV